MDRGAWWATVHRVAKIWTGLKEFSTHAQLIYNVVLVSRVQQSDSVIHIHIPIFSGFETAQLEFHHFH